MDENFTDLRDGVNLQIPKTQGLGIRLDSLGTPAFGWHDMIGIPVVDEGSITKPDLNVFVGSIKQQQYTEGDELFTKFHMPHDYVMGSDIYVHMHWAHDSSLVTGGSVTWGFELSYSKGHNQAIFPATTSTVTILQAADTVNLRQHMIAETAASVVGGSGTQLDTNDLEVDGVILCRTFLDSNDITVSGGGIPEPFGFFVDIHYQSTGLPTLQRAPDFWT
ncbi:MAG: hypothetical protein KAX49_19165 [Halanaerobiales bacterium]|nr:hypothetical protein [Halanaerobiales bacterium]